VFAVSHYVTLAVEHHIILVVQQNEIYNTYSVCNYIPTLICDNQATTVNISHLYSDDYFSYVNNIFWIAYALQTNNNYTFPFKYHNLDILISIFHLLLLQVPHGNFKTYSSITNSTQPQNLREYLWEYSYKKANTRNVTCMWSSHEC
jgi:hypothetical protein